MGPRQWTFLEFLFNPGKFEYIKKIELQFVYWSQYPIVLKNYAGGILQAIIDVKTAELLIPHFLIGYAILSFIIYKRLPKQRPMLFAILFGAILIFYLNSYFGQYDILNYSGSSRYLFFPTFLLAIFWAYALWALFWKKRTILALVGIFLLIGYYIMNFLLIQASFIEASSLNRSTRSIFNHIIKTRSQLSKGTLIITTYPEFGILESQFFTETLGKGEVRYMSELNLNDIDTWEKAASISAKAIKVVYDRECDCVKETSIK